MTGYVADLSWKSGARAIEKLDRLRSTMAVNVLKGEKIMNKNKFHTFITLNYDEVLKKKWNMKTKTTYLT